MTDKDRCENGVELKEALERLINDCKEITGIEAYNDEKEVLIRLKNKLKKCIFIERPKKRRPISDVGKCVNWFLSSDKWVTQVCVGGEIEFVLFEESLRVSCAQIWRISTGKSHTPDWWPVELMEEVTE